MFLKKLIRRKFIAICILGVVFVMLEIFTSNYRQDGIVRTKEKKNKEVLVPTLERILPILKIKGLVLLILSLAYSLVSCNIISLLFSDKFYTKIASLVHLLLIGLSLFFFLIAFISGFKNFMNVSRFFLFLVLSPWLLIFFVAGFPLYKKGLKVNQA